MAAVELLAQLQKLGIRVEKAGDKLRLIPGSKVPPELVQVVQANKQEIIAVITGEDVCPEWHAEEIAAQVRREGVCIFWSELFSETVAFVGDDAHGLLVPCGIVAYTIEELEELFDRDVDDATRRLMHEGKKLGAQIKRRGH
ncbi:MAG: hypothetical protein HYX89_07400 [Chloroflexi bacterium]|nr:hypothetical protein [Chloroflexota bacterium]